MKELLDKGFHIQTSWGCFNELKEFSLCKDSPSGGVVYIISQMNFPPNLPFQNLGSQSGSSTGAGITGEVHFEPQPSSPVAQSWLHTGITWEP